MKICKIDDRGRAQLQKLVSNLSWYYKFEEDENNVITLTPLNVMESVSELD
jgi:hypothetical protein